MLRAWSPWTGTRGAHGRLGRRGERARAAAAPGRGPQAAARQAAALFALSGVLALRLNDARNAIADMEGWRAALTATPAHALGNPDLPDEVLTVCADPERLEQILLNVISNAIRHGRPPVQVRAIRAAQAVVVEVRDHGSGVPDDSSGTLFERLSGSDSDPTR